MPLFSEWQIPIKTEQEVSRKPRTIDIVITCTPSDIEKVKLETTFDFFAKNNIIAFKSPTDPLTIWEYLKITARARFYMLHPQKTREVLMMTGKIPIPEENVKFIVKDLGIDRILRHANIDEVVRCIDVEDRLRGLSHEELKKLQKLLNEKIKEDER